MAHQDSNPGNRNPGRIGKDGEHNDMDRKSGSGQQTFTNPGEIAAEVIGTNRSGQSGEPGGLGSQQADDQGGIGGQGLGNRSGKTGAQVDDNQDDLGRDVNQPERPSTNNRPDRHDNTR